MVLDQQADGTREAFAKFAGYYGLPDYVRRASVESVFEPPAELPSSSFADVRNRKFPVHTKAATEVSYRYFLDSKHQLDPKVASMIDDRFQVMGRCWNIEADLRALREKHAQLNIVPPPADEDYLLLYKTAESVERHYPLTGGPATKAAAAWFLAHRDHFPFADRRQMAEKLLDKAARYAVALTGEQREALEKQAGHGICDAPKTVTAIHNRLRAANAKLVPQPVYAGLQKVAAEFQRRPELAADPGTLVMLCETIDTFDKLAELKGQYGELLPRPEDAVFAVTLDAMRETVKSACTLTTGHVFNQQQFAKLSVQELRDSYGANLASAVCDALGQQVDPVKLAEVAPTLPRGDANLLVRMLAGHGEQPLFKQADGPVHFSREELQALAAVDNFSAALGGAGGPSPAA